MAQVSDQDLATYLTTLAKILAHETPAFKKASIDINKLIADTTGLLRFKESESNQPLNHEALMHPDFIQQILITMSAMATISSSNDLTKIIELLDKALKQIKQSNNYMQQLKSMANEQNEMQEALFEILGDLQELQSLPPDAKEKILDKIRKKMRKRLKSKALKKLEAMLNMSFIPQSTDTIKQAIQKLINAIKVNIESTKKSSLKSEKIPTDIYINLFGILSSYITGSHPVPMQSYIGNGLGFADWNPYHGSANIDNINNIQLAFGDSLGLEAKTISNYFAMSVNTIINSINLLQEAGFTPVSPEAAPSLGLAVSRLCRRE